MSHRSVEKLTFFYLKGAPAAAGNLADLPNELTMFRRRGSITAVGNIADLPNGTYFYVSGQNAINDTSARQ